MNRDSRCGKVEEWKVFVERTVTANDSIEEREIFSRLGQKFMISIISFFTEKDFPNGPALQSYKFRAQNTICLQTKEEILVSKF